MPFGYHSLVRRYKLLNLKYLSALNLTSMHIMLSKQCYRFQKILKFYRYAEDSCGLFYRQYHRLTRTGTYLNFGMNFSFLIISLLILGLFSNLMSRKSYIYMFANL